MPYVMVPVPAEVEEEFGQWLLARALQAKLNSWPDGVLATLYEDSDEVTRDLLVCLARDDAYAVEAAGLAAALDLTEQDVVDRVRAVVERCNAESWPALVLVDADHRPTPGAAPTLAFMMGGQARIELRRLLGG